MLSYTDTLNYIFNLRGGEIDLRLERVRQALALFDHPEKRYQAFHIAGTNGKGSTAAMTHSILSAQGYRAALYISPHLVSFTERIRIKDQDISREEVIDLAALIRKRLAQNGASLTFFEFVTLMALVYFVEKEVDVAVVEVGLGGRLDATNVVRPAVSVITSIAMDHEAYLGNDLASIAGEKGGIIKEGVPVVVGAVPSEAEEVLRKLAAANKTACYFSGQDFSCTIKENGRFDYAGPEWQWEGLSVALHGRFQRHNASLALASLEIARASFPVTEEAVRVGLERVSWPGRLETVLERPRVILDGAHNVEGVKALTAELRTLSKGNGVRLVFGAMHDKDWRSMLCELTSVAGRIVLTKIPMPRSAEPAVLAEAISDRTAVQIVEDPVQAVRSVLEKSSDEDIIVVAGSLYLLGEVKPFLTEVAAGRAARILPGDRV
ncbi:MAG: bifunctional folylpolyglutamate synthase/dihydrofolate synthase [Candidatus Binatia bacterium]